MYKEELKKKFKNYRKHLICNKYFEIVDRCFNKKINFNKCKDVILLCAGKKFGRYEHDKYLGGPDRKNAAINVAKNENIEQIIVVGGGIEKENEKEEKVNFMFNFLKKAGINEEKIVKVVSEADTHGNFRAIYKIFKAKDIKWKGRKIGVITNLYHVPRALKFAEDTFKEYKDLEFIPIPAELIIEKPEDINKHQEQIIKRIEEEINGLKDWNNGNYRNQKIKPECWRGEIINS